jgi:hypothetical protein
MAGEWPKKRDDKHRAQTELWQGQPSQHLGDVSRKPCFHLVHSVAKGSHVEIIYKIISLLKK